MVVVVRIASLIKKCSYCVICTTLGKEYDITWLNKCDQTSG